MSTDRQRWRRFGVGPAEFPYLVVPCARCGVSINVVVPFRLRLAADSRGTYRGSLERANGFGPPELCTSCRVSAIPVLDRACVGDEFARYRALKADLGMPPDALCWVVEIADGGVAPYWRGFACHLLGVETTGLPWPCALPALKLTPDADFPPVELLLYRRAAWCTGIPAVLELRWHPARGESPLQVRD